MKISRGEKKEIIERLPEWVITVGKICKEILENEYPERIEMLNKDK